MIQIILFVAACLVWQAIKNKLRGPRRPTVSLTGGGAHILAVCGCDVVDNRVARPCAAHKVMIETGRD